MPDPAQPQMLWESADPLSELPRRFGFATADEACGWATRQLGENHRLRVVGLDRAVISFHNLMLWVQTESAGPVIVKICRQAETHSALTVRGELVQWLADRGHPVARPLLTSAGEHQILRDGRSLGIQPVLPGSLLDPADRAAVRAAGRSLAALHTDIAAWPDADRLEGDRSVLAEQELRALPGRAADGPTDLSDRLERRLLELPPVPSTQPVHGDFRGANILCHRGEVTGILDFEEARIGAAVHDVAQAVCLLGTWFHDWRPLSPATEETFLSGYRERRTLADAEQQWLAPLTARTMLGLGWWDDARRWLC